MMRLPAASGLWGFRITPGTVSALKYITVLGLCLAVSAGSANFISSSAMSQLAAPSTSPAHRTTPLVEISVPDTPVMMPAPVVAASAPAVAPIDSAASATPDISVMDAPDADLGAGAAQVNDGQTIDDGQVQTVALDGQSEVAQPDAFGGQQMFVRHGVNIRANPVKGSAKVGLLQGGDTVDVVDQRDGWYQVAQNSVVLGWVYRDYLSGNPSGQIAEIDTQAPRSQRSTVSIDDNGDTFDHPVPPGLVGSPSSLSN